MGMANRVKGYLVDVKQGTVGVVEFEDTLQNIYTLLDVDVIDVVERKVGNHIFDVICDDEGLLKSDYVVSAYSSDKEPVLVGNLLLVNHDGNGDFTSITDEQVAEIEQCVSSVITSDSGEIKMRKVLVGVDYV